MNKLAVSTKRAGNAIKPLHAVNGGPLTYNFMIDTSDHFKNAHIPYSRLHDIEYPMGSGEFVDIHCIFPDFNADPDLPESYNFTCTDTYIKAIIDSDCQVVYRLGESIDHGPIKKHINPPKDFHKWAKICEGIIKHYNEGWAGGYKYNIKYWEIWNESESPKMWAGTKEEYFNLYEITSNHLKNRFPEIMIGGYASCGFYAITRPDIGEYHESFVTFFEDFLAYISNPKTRAPLDFFSWHIYNTDPEEIAIHSKYVDQKLRDNGFQHTESHLNEWNYGAGASISRFSDMRSMKGAIHTAKVLCLLQTLPVDMAMFYDAQPRQRYGSLFELYTTTPAKTYYPLKAFGSLYNLGKEAESSCSDRNIYYCAATDGGDIAVMVSGTETGDIKLSVNLNDIADNRKIVIFQLDEKTDLLPVAEYTDHSFEITIMEKSMILIETQEI